MQLAPHSSARRSAAGRAIAAGAACAVLLLTGCQGSRWETRTGEPDVPQRVLNLDLGLRNLEEDWAPADSQFTYGLHYAQTLTEGGPLKATQTLSIMTYDQAFGFFNFGYASAVGVVTLVICVVASLLMLGRGSKAMY